MNYYEVLVSDASYHGKGPLTYASSKKLKPGGVVKVPIQKKEVLAWVFKEVSKPRFATKPVSSILTDYALPRELLELHTWIQDYYPAPLGQITNLFLPSYLSVTNYEMPDARTDAAKTKNVSLTSEQKATLLALSKDKLSSAIIHGSTGSGKTVVYAQMARQYLAQGKAALILTPEIGLTPQLAKDLRDYLGNQVFVVHSGLTPKQRAGLWHQIAKSKVAVVVGPRSALFSPINNLGLIVIDEFHDQA